MKIKVAIADDHQLFMDGINLILAKEIDISIISEALNGLELIRNIEKGPLPDIIITDIRMPVMDGIAATRFLSKQFPKIPVLALTMYDQSADVIEMLEAGAKGYVTKDVEKEELITAIKTLFNGKNYFSNNLPKDIQNWAESENSDSDIVLTRREKEILTLLAKGRTTIQMAQQLKISKLTIDTHRKNIHKKIGIKSNAGLVSYAMQNLLIKN